MNLASELENDLALAFLVEKKHSEKIDSKEVLVLLNKIREVLKPLSTDEKLNENVLVAGIAENALAHWFRFPYLCLENYFLLTFMLL